MDTTKAITHVSLCAGYGGIDLGLRRAIPALRTIAVSEIEAFACANLVAKMEAGLLDPAPIWTDLKTFPWAEFRDRVDILSGGYPCQPFSAAGKRLGAEDPRHLWPHISAGIALMRPSVCFFENVEGHISLGLPDVIEDLAGLGYRTTWGIFSASEVGAPHQRKRVFIMAYDGNNAGSHFWSRFIDHRRSRQAAHVSSQASHQQAWRDCGEGRRQDASSDIGFSGCGSSELAYRECEGLERFYNRNASTEPSEHVSADAWTSGECGAWPSRPGEQQHWWEPPRVVGVSDELRPQGRHDTGSLQAMGISRAEFAGANGKHYRGPAQSSLGGNFARTPSWLDDAELFTTCDNRTDELRLLGNGVVPATAERAFRVLVGELMEHQP